MKKSFISAVSALISRPLAAAVVEKTIGYEQGGVKLESFHAHDAAGKP